MWLPASFLARTFASPNLSHEPKAKVATKGQFVQFLHLVLCPHEILILPLDQKNKGKKNWNYLILKRLLGTQIASKVVHFLCCNPVNATCIHKIYNNGLLKLKNMDWFVVCASIYTCIFLYEFYLGYIIETQYMIC
jgi:hypothetical protein